MRREASRPSEEAIAARKLVVASSPRDVCLVPDAGSFTAIAIFAGFLDGAGDGVAVLLGEEPDDNVADGVGVGDLDDVRVTGGVDKGVKVALVLTVGVAVGDNEDVNEEERVGDNEEELVGETATVPDVVGDTVRDTDTDGGMSELFLRQLASVTRPTVSVTSEVSAHPLGSTLATRLSSHENRAPPLIARGKLRSPAVGFLMIVTWPTAVRAIGRIMPSWKAHASRPSAVDEMVPKTRGPSTLTEIFVRSLL